MYAFFHFFIGRTLNNANLLIASSKKKKFLVFQVWHNFAARDMSKFVYAHANMVFCYFLSYPSILHLCIVHLNNKMYSYELQERPNIIRIYSSKVGYLNYVRTSTNFKSTQTNCNQIVLLIFPNTEVEIANDTKLATNSIHFIYLLV